jgi:hypothetical protein
MFRYAALIMLALSAPALAQPPRGDPAAARQILERDWVVMNWALKFYDKDRDILLSAAEAQAAADAFRAMADTDKDGRVTTHEYRSARIAILSR